MITTNSYNYTWKQLFLTCFIKLYLILFLHHFFFVVCCVDLDEVFGGLLPLLGPEGFPVLLGQFGFGSGAFLLIN